MKSYSIILFILIIIGFANCSSEQPSTWNEKGRVWFPSSDTVSIVSFKKVNNDINEVILNIPITIAGTKESYDRDITVQLVADKKNAGTRYDIILPVIVPADSTRANVQAKIYRTANLAENADTIVLGISSSKDFEPGLRNNLHCKIIVTDKYDIPWWWYSSILGNYSEDKHAVVFAVFGNDDDIRGSSTSTNIKANWTSADALYNIYLLNKYCEKQGYTFRFERNK